MIAFSGDRTHGQGAGHLAVFDHVAKRRKIVDNNGKIGPQPLVQKIEHVPQDAGQAAVFMNNQGRVKVIRISKADIGVGFQPGALFRAQGDGSRRPFFVDKALRNVGRCAQAETIKANCYEPIALGVDVPDRYQIGHDHLVDHFGLEGQLVAGEAWIVAGQNQSDDFVLVLQRIIPALQGGPQDLLYPFGMVGEFTFGGKQVVTVKVDAEAARIDDVDIHAHLLQKKGLIRQIAGHGIHFAADQACNPLGAGDHANTVHPAQCFRYHGGNGCTTDGVAGQHDLFANQVTWAQDIA